MDEQSQEHGSPNGGSSQKKAQRYAVIVGINDYSGSGLANLSFCARDAEAFYDALLHFADYTADNVRLFSDGSHPKALKPTYSDILSAVKQVASNATETDSILLFFAGHGTYGDGDNYLLTKEFRPNVIAESSICMTKIDDYFNSSSAKFKLRILDACHSGRMGVRGLPNPNIDDLLSVTAEGWATLAACKEDQYAHELNEFGHGLFSYFLIKGLSGEAAVDGSRVTLDNLKVFVMDRTIETSRKLGLEQTPVFSGEQAGSLVLVRITPESKGELPSALVAIGQSDVTSIEPAADDTASLLGEISDALLRPRASLLYVAPNQDGKIEFLKQATSTLAHWAQGQVDTAAKRLPDGCSLSAEVVPTSRLPLNYSLAIHLSKSRAKSALEWTFQYQSETKYRKERKRPYGALALASMLNPEYESVPYTESVVAGILQPQDYPDSSLAVTFTPANCHYPICLMAVALIPSNFGVLFASHFASTQLGGQMKEVWNPSSFSMRALEALPVADSSFATLIQKLSELYAQFLSFTSESIEARHKWFESLGAGPENSLL